jgi:Domain of unknown function (DUF4124)
MSCLLPAVLFALPLAASAAVGASASVYKWTDERGTMVFSNRPPPADAKVSNVQVVVEDDEPAAARKPTAAPKLENGNALQERVRALEQQVQALQTPAATYAAAPYPVQLPPPTNYYPSPNYYPPPDYYPPSSYPSAYPSAYPPPMYGYPYYPYAASYVVVEPPSFVRPVHEFGGFRFGVHPMPLTYVVGVTYRR